MRNTKTFLTLFLLILLGSMGAAQAQIARVDLLAQPAPAAREGGKNEAAGVVWLDIDITRARSQRRWHLLLLPTPRRLQLG